MGTISGLAVWEKSHPQVQVDLVQKALFEAFIAVPLHFNLAYGRVDVQCLTNISQGLFQL